MPAIGGVLAVVGLGGTLAATFGENHARAWFSYLFAYMFCLSIASGSLGWILIDQVARAGWSVVIRRLTETGMATIPVFAILFLPIVTLGFHDLFAWSHEGDKVARAQRWFLSPGFFYARAAIYFVVWIVLSRLLYGYSTRNDTEGADVSKRDALVRKMWAVAAPGILLWALTQSFAAIDWMMSLDSHWYSTIFGVYFFAGSILGFFAVVTLIAMSLQRSGVLKEVTTEHYHDLGKYLFGFTIFWAYIGFAQFMLIWYANLPEETEFYLVRIHGGWEWISYGLPIIHFFFPFLVNLSRHVKRSRMGLAFVAIWLLAMQLVDIYWLVMPNYGRFLEKPVASTFSIAWTDVAALVGMAGAFLAAYAWFLGKNKVIAINDPRLTESLVHENY
jgi:hypothetical protein